MKRLNVLALVLATTAAPWAAAQDTPRRGSVSVLEGDGTGIGNGIPYEILEAETLTMRRQVGLLTIAGTASPSMEELSNWCSSVAAMLQSSLETAVAYANSRSVELAEAILVRALQVARDSMVIRSGYEGPVARKMVTRALTIHQALTFTPPSAAPVPLESRFAFLRSYILLSIREIQSFDRLLAIPFQWAYLPCTTPAAAGYATCPTTGIPSGFDIAAYNSRYLEFVQTQLRYVMGSEVVTRTAPRYGEQYFAPSLDSRAMLRVTEHVIRYVAEDLNESVLRLAGACTYLRLSNWADRLQVYNLTGTSPYGSLRALLNQNARNLNEAFNEISSCGTH